MRQRSRSKAHLMSRSTVDIGSVISVTIIMGLGDSRQMFMRILIPNKPFVVYFRLVSRTSRTVHEYVQE
jgi:hypothetical protein